jgi:HlyD family secretion protein
LDADFGDRVGKGDILATLNSREQLARVTSARAAAAQADAAAQQAVSALGRAEVALRQKLAVSERRAELARRGTTSNETSEDARAAFEMAEADVALAGSAVTVARENVNQARALVEVEEARLGKYTLLAPFDGVVVAREANLGAMLNPGQALYTLADPQSILALAYVDEAKASELAIGQPARVRLRSDARTSHSARVERIDIESDRVNEERRVYVKCDVCPSDFHLGEQAEVVITVATLKTALMVPLAAVRGLAGDTGTVWVLRDGRIAEASLTFGHRTLDGRLEVVGGVPGGAMVVVAPTAGLTAGRAARLDEAAAR